MAVEPRPEASEDVMERVLRRAEVAKMARKLQDRLALASYKTKHGLDNMKFNLVEAHLDETIRRRPGSSVGSSGSSTASSDMIPYNRALQSSPLSAPIFSDDIYPDINVTGSRKRARFAAPYDVPTPTTGGGRSRRKRQSQSVRRRRSQPNLSASSPLAGRFEADFRTSHGPQLSFVSSDSTTSDSPPFGNSDNEGPSLPTPYQGSLPQTPPPTRSRGLRGNKHGSNHVDDGPNLLLYLATSPSPAQASKATPRIIAPSTPPQQNSALPSSIMNTPGGGNSLFAGFNTPGQQFNFADFINVTPSPAQGAFGSRTPGPTKTPLAAKEARRRLNFDSLQPPTGSPNLGRNLSGLGMDLGGELGST